MPSRGPPGASVQPASPLRASLFNLGWLSFGRFFGDAAIFLLLVVISRWHGEEGLGQYAFAMAFALFYAVAADLGIYLMFIREAPHARIPIATYFGQVFSLGLCLSVASLLALLVTIGVVPFPRETKIFLLVIGVYLLISKLAEGCGTLFLAVHKTHLSGSLEVASKAGAALVASALIAAEVDLAVALIALPCVAFCQLLASCLLIVAKVGPPRLIFRPSALLASLRGTARYAASALQVPVYARADVLVLGLLLTTAAVGIYSAAFRVVFLLIILANLASLSLLPLIGKLYVSSLDRYRAAYHATVGAAILIAMPAAAGLALIAPQIIAFLFGPEFVDAAGVLRILSVVVVLFALRSLLSIFLTTGNLQGQRATAEWLGAATVWAACLLLVPLAGVYGAALSVVIAEGTMVAVMLIRLSPLCGWPEVGSRLFMSVLGTAAFCLPALVWPAFPAPVIVVLSVMIYGATLALCADIRRTEYRLLWTTLARPAPARRIIGGGGDRG